MQIAVEDAAELRASVGELEDARFNVEIFDSAGREISRWDLPTSDTRQALGTSAKAANESR